MSILQDIRSQPTCSVAGFGRVFYGASDRLYFSQVFIDDLTSLARCYQRNDPTAEIANDILDTDGGEILLQESGAIINMVKFHTGILLMCQKGVWFLSGPDGGFTATAYKLDRLSGDRIVGTRAFCEVKSSVFFGTPDGINTVSINEFGQPVVNSVTEQTVRSYWQDFVSDSIQMAHDEKEDRVYILRCSCPEGRVLVYDMKLNAFFPWKIGGSPPVDGEEIIYEGLFYSKKQQKMIFCARKLGTMGSITRIYTAHQVKQAVHKDFNRESYYSYLVTNYETLGNYSRNKGAPLINVMMRKTEEQITEFDAGTKTYSFDNPSGVKMSVLWDWNTESSPRRKTDVKNIYKPVPRWFIPESIPSVFDTGETIITYKDKVRGKGRAVQFKFEADGDKSMELLGFSVTFSSKGRS